MSWNQIGDEGTRRLSEALKHGNTSKFLIVRYVPGCLFHLSNQSTADFIHSLVFHFDDGMFIYSLSKSPCFYFSMILSKLCFIIQLVKTNSYIKKRNCKPRKIEVSVDGETLV